jgi:hypothetical protein
MALLSRLIAKIRVVASYSQVRFQEAEMKDMKIYRVGQRTLSIDDEDFKNVLCKRDIATILEACVRNRGFKTVSLDESEENEARATRSKARLSWGTYKVKRKF